MVDIQITGSANFKAVESQFRALQAQVASLNKELAATGIAAQGVNPNGYRRMQAMMRDSSNTFRAAAASTGQFYTEQIRLNSATEEFTKNLDKQKLSLRDIVKQRKVAAEAYREQVRIQNMYVREAPSMSRGGKGLYDIAVPRQLSSEMNTLGQKINWVNSLIQSSTTQMINWGKNVQWAGRQLMVGFTIPTAAFGVAAGAMAYQVDQQLTRIKKVYDTTAVAIAGDTASMGAVNKELAEVTRAAWNTATESAQKYGAAATDTMGVQADLAATGLKGAALQEATNEVMRIATLGELDYQEATTATIALQSAYKLSTKELTEAFNFMNATENATSLSIQDIIESTPRAASAMSALGVSVEQMVVMLTSMRESGVDAAEAANALKSATGSILAPSPAADEFIRQITNGRVQVTKLAEESGGNLYNAMGLLFEQMEGLSQLQKQQILVKLFGKYQFSRVSAMVYNMGDAFASMRGEVGATANQTAKAMELMGKSTEELANTAEVELGRWQESASGQFKAGLEELKIELAQMGEPFLKIGAIALKVATKVMKFFNNLGDGTKTAIAVAATVAALIGPMVMLTGLTANFIGTITKGITWFALLGKRMGIVTKETKAMELASQAAKAGWDTQTTAVMNLTTQIEKLMAAEMAAKGMAIGTRVPINTTQPAANSWAAQQQAKWQQSMNMPSTVQLGPQTAQVAENLEKSATSGTKLRNALLGTGASIGVATAGMVAMSVSSNEVVDNISQVAIGAGSLGMMFGPWGAAVGAIGTGIWLWSKHLKAAHDEQLKTQDAINNATEKWAAGAQKVLKEFKGIQQASLIQTPGAKSDPVADAKKRWSSDEMKETIDAYNKIGSSAKQAAYLVNMYVDMQAKAGLSAREATTEIQGMLMAAGMSAGQAESEAQHLMDTLGDLDRKDIVVQLKANIDLADVSDPELAYKAGKATGESYYRAFSEAANETEARAVTQQILDKQDAMWDDMYDQLLPATQKRWKELGINSASSFYKALKEGTIEWGGQDLVGGTLSSNDILKQVQAIQAFGNGVANASGEMAGLGSEISSIDELMDSVLWKSKTNTEQQNKNLAASIAIGGQVAGAVNKAAGEEALRNLNTIAANMNLKEGKDIAEALANILNGVPPDIADAANEADKMAGKLRSAYDSAFVLGDKYAKDILKNSMNDLQNSMAQQAADNFQERMDNALDAAQAAWDNRIKGQEKRDDREMKRFDKSWENRKDKVDDYYDSQVDAIDKSIKKQDEAIKQQDAIIDAEKKAEEVRQRMFDAQMTRLSRLSQIANNNIDLNLAINTGDLDEAARINLQMNTQNQEWALEDAKAASELRSKDATDSMEAFKEKKQLRKENLQDEKDAIEEARQAEMESLEKREDRLREHLKNTQEARMESLRTQQEAEMKARRKSWELDQKMYNQKLDLFKSFAARDQADLEAWMQRVGLSYADFGDKSLKPMGQDWASFFKDQLYKKIQTAGAQIASDKMWEDMAKQEASAVLRGFGFNNMKELGHFIKTGEMPKLKTKNDSGPSTVTGGDGKPGVTTDYNNTMHTGGVVGGATGSRRGVAKTTRGLHPSEQMIRAQKGEYIVNRRDAAKNGPVLDAINNGIYDGTPNRRGVMGGLGMPGLISAVASSMLTKGVAQAAVGRGVEKGQKRAANLSVGSTFSGLKGGIFGDSNINFDAEQLSNAAIIASVGSSMGMSKRDIQIGIMTAITESMLRNLSGGDRDSAGLFQQRPSMGWGTLAQVTDPEYAARKFFEGLKGVSNRGTLSPWIAAQTVQRSFDPTGSNYQKYWDEAQSIFANGLAAAESGTGFIQGSGGKHRPVSSGTPGGLHDTDTAFPGVDLAIPIGSNIYAAGDGVITESYDIKGYEARRKVRGVMGDSVQDGYRSYGRVIVEELKNGLKVLYAHLSERLVKAGDIVRGGALIGKSGNTGYVLSNSGDGAHLHFGASDGNPLAFFKKGGKVKGDGPAYLHDGETVVNAKLSKNFEQGINAIAQAASKGKGKGGAWTSQPAGNFPTNNNSNAWTSQVVGEMPKSNDQTWTSQVIGAFEDVIAKTPKDVTPTFSTNSFSEESQMNYDPNRPGSGFLNIQNAIASAVEAVAASSKSNKEAKASGTGKEETVRTGTYNISWRSPHNTTPGALNKLMGAADVLSLQEIYKDRVGLVRKTLQDNNWGMSDFQDDSIVAYNKTKYSMIKSGNRGMNPDNAGKGVHRNRNAAWALLRSNAGNEFFQLSAHTNPMFGQKTKGGKNYEIQRDQYGVLSDMVKEFSKRAPVILGGDLNWELERPGGIPIANLTSVLQGKNGLNGLHTHAGGGDVDHIMYGPGSKLVSSKIMGGLPSDHNALISEIKLPQLKVGGFTQSDGIAKLHDEETVLTKPLTKEFKQGVANFANGGENRYNITMHANDGMSEEALVRATFREIDRRERRLPRGRTD